MSDTAERLAKALEQCEGVLRLVERPALSDPKTWLHSSIKVLGRAFGFGAIMTTASAGWREVLEEDGMPTGSEFVAGPCHVTVQQTLKTTREALAAYRSEKQP